MARLADFLLTAKNRPKVVADCERLVDFEVAQKGGLSGLAVKGAYAVVKRLKPGIVGIVVDKLLDDFVNQLEPFFNDFLTQKNQDLGEVWGPKAEAIALSLLRITDQRAAQSGHPALIAAYNKLRPSGVKHTAAAVPGLGRLIQKFI